MPASITLVKRLVKGSPLTATEMDANLTNLSEGITGDYAKFLEAHDADGKVLSTAGTVPGGALAAGTVTYDKLSSIFYAGDDNADGDKIKITLSELTAAPAVGSVFFVKVKGANTGDVDVEIVTGEVTTTGKLYKTGTIELANGDLVDNQIIAMAWAGSDVFHLLSNLSVSDPGIVKIATDSTHTAVTINAATESPILTYPLQSNSYSKIIIRVTARIIAEYNKQTQVQFYKAGTAVLPSYDIPQMQVTGLALNVKYAPWQTFVAEFAGGNTGVENIVLNKMGTNDDYAAEVDFLEVYGVI